MRDLFKTYSGDPWHADEDEYGVRLFRGNLQMAKMPKQSEEYECYWPSTDTMMWMLQVLNEAELRGIAAPNSKPHTTMVYRILHVPTGMYYCPSREVKVKLPDDQAYHAHSGRYIKSNLSKTGKTYTKKPSLAYVGKYYYTHLITSARELNGHAGAYCILPVVKSEWQVEQVSTVSV
jgi:hypothetical protein